MDIQSPVTSLPVTIEVLSPVHIGDGGVLKRSLDFVVHGGRTYVIHIDRYAHWAYGEMSGEDWMNVPPGDILHDYSPEALDVFRYRMSGAPEKDEVRTFEKNGFGLPYLPGSTLKGMLRTAFIWGLYAAQDKKPDLDRLGKSRSFAGQPVEREMIGSDPNRDLFRAVHVRDSQPPKAGDLRVVSVDIYPTSHGDGAGAVTACEAAPEGMVFETTMALDSYGFRDKPAADLGWSGKAHWVTPGVLAQLGRAFAEQRLRQELEYFADREDTKIVRGFYRSELVKRFNSLGENQFLAQIGWGTGWNSKTLNDLLLADPRRFARIVQQYKLKRNAAAFAPGDRFPKSRHLLRSQGQPVRPMGWVLVTVG